MQFPIYSKRRIGISEVKVQVFGERLLSKIVEWKGYLLVWFLADSNWFNGIKQTLHTWDKLKCLHIIFSLLDLID